MSRYQNLKEDKTKDKYHRNSINIKTHLIYFTDANRQTHLIYFTDA